MCYETTLSEQEICVDPEKVKLNRCIVLLINKTSICLNIQKLTFRWPYEKPTRIAEN